ncbi:MAG: hypothetical protein R6U22_08115 [Desulfohalobiaceae bacterium]
MSETKDLMSKQSKVGKPCSSYVHEYSIKAAHIVLFFAAIFILSGFSADKDALIGKWECDVDKTMENMDTSQISDMEEQYYYNYFQEVSLEVTENEMIAEQKGIKDTTAYEVVEKDNNKIIVNYPEEDEDDSFILLDENSMKWSLDTKNGEIDVFFNKQQ